MNKALKKMGRPPANQAEVTQILKEYDQNQDGKLDKN